MNSSEPAAATLRVRHLTCYEYDAPVELAHHLAHLRPRDTAVQTRVGLAAGGGA